MLLASLMCFGNEQLYPTESSATPTLPTRGNDRTTDPRERSQPLRSELKENLRQLKEYGYDYVPGLLAELAEQDILG